MLLITTCSPLSLIGFAIGLVNQISVTPDIATPHTAPAAKVFRGAVQNPASYSTAQPAASVRTAVRDSVQTSDAPAVPIDAHFIVNPGGFSMTDQSAGPATSPANAGTVDAQDIELIRLINHERTAQGLNPLVPDPLLSSVALGHSEDMCNRNYFDHIAPSPGPASPMDRYLAASPARPDYAMVGENIFYRSNTDSIAQYATEAHTAFMNSPGHRANILTPQYTNVGIGIYRNPVTGEYWVTEMFCTTTQPK